MRGAREVRAAAAACAVCVRDVERVDCGGGVRGISYVKGHGFSYWIPLQFSPAGDILPFAPFVNSFSLDVAEGFGVEHLPARGS
jgi:hypothetical protein